MSTEKGLTFDGVETERYNVRNTGKVSFNPEHPFIRDFIELNKIVNGRAVAKQTIPSPNQLFAVGIHNEDIYPDIEDYANDIIKAYQHALKAFYEAGVRYLQLDDVYIARLSAPDFQFKDGKYTREQLIDLALRVINGALEGKPEDLVVTTHLCRGNYQSTGRLKEAMPVSPQLYWQKKQWMDFSWNMMINAQEISSHWNTFQMAVHGSYWVSSLQKMEKSKTRKLLRHALKKPRTSFLSNNYA